MLTRKQRKERRANPGKFSRQRRNKVRSRGVLAEKNTELANFITDRGWTIAGDVWSKQNWKAEHSKNDGVCKTTLRRAYQIQLKLDLEQAEQNESE